MAKGDDILQLILAVSEMTNTIAKNLLKILKIVRKKSGRLKTKTTEIETITTENYNE